MVAVVKEVGGEEEEDEKGEDKEEVERGEEGEGEVEEEEDGEGEREVEEEEDDEEGSAKILPSTEPRLL